MSTRKRKFSSSIRDTLTASPPLSTVSAAWSRRQSPPILIIQRSAAYRARSAKNWLGLSRNPLDKPRGFLGLPPPRFFYFHFTSKRSRHSRAALRRLPKFHVKR